VFLIGEHVRRLDEFAIVSLIEFSIQP
jgi:hypothetical protein